MKRFVALIAFVLSVFSVWAGRIDRKALMDRNCPIVTEMDTLASLSVGNGEFAVTVDATGLQTFPEYYSGGVPLGTQSQWGWHSFSNPENLQFDETLRSYDFGRGHQELYACQVKADDSVRGKKASDWYRANPHRLHLGVVGFDFGKKATPANVHNIYQTLDLWNGEIRSSFQYNNKTFEVQTVCHPKLDMMSTRIQNMNKTPLLIRFPYPTGKHSDDACDWNSDNMHETEMVPIPSGAVLKRILDGTAYFVTIQWTGKVDMKRVGRNCFRLKPSSVDWSLSVKYSKTFPFETHVLPGFTETQKATAEHWHDFWTEGAAVDFSRCIDPRAKELERRVVLSQYLLAIQSAGSVPPQETGLTYNSWFGKFHLEMIYWHEAWLPLWGHGDMLRKALKWYKSAEPIARQIAERQGFKGVRWMKMTDPSGIEAPSNVGSFLIWQQPHLIQLAELVYQSYLSKDDYNGDEYRRDKANAFLHEYAELVEETAVMMADFANYNEEKNRWELRGFIPAQETLSAKTTVNAPFELSYWHYGLSVAQEWRKRLGREPNQLWQDIIDHLSPLAKNSDNLYLAAENATDTYTDIKYTSDHMAVLGALGILPGYYGIDREVMHNTLNWVWNGWNWDKTWGWDYPMTAMCAARLGEPEMAVNALLMDKRTNTYLKNGHNYQDGRLRIYLPGNGGLLTAVALMCNGWEGSKGNCPGFPRGWDVIWER
ncbi:MAG: hypothetical protein II947_10815 [Bacteroidaceae bacterium]|nr:hypothetical protein [Bacteroidaceae bacterium]